MFCTIVAARVTAIQQSISIELHRKDNAVSQTINYAARNDKWIVKRGGEYLEWVDASDVQWGDDPILFKSEAAASSAVKIVRARCSK